MDKQCTIIGCSTIDRLKHAIDWSLCVICQKSSHKQALVCPVESKLRKTGDGYLTLEFDDKCFFCESCNDTEKLWQVRTLGVDSRVRECASVLNDVHLLSKLSEGDLIAREAKYHARCLVAFYNRASRVGSANSESTGNNSVQSINIALAELIAYIEDIRSNETIAPVFRLSELTKLYVSRLNQLGIAHDAREHSTRLK